MVMVALKIEKMKERKVTGRSSLITPQYYVKEQATVRTVWQL